MQAEWIPPAHVLLVADNDSQLIGFALELMQSGYAISTAQDAPQALLQLTAKTWDAVIVDHRPTEAALAICRAIRAGAAESPIVMLLPAADVAAIPDALSAGVYELVLAPPIEALLRAALDRATAYQRLKRMSTSGTITKPSPKLVHDINNALSGILGIAQIRNDDEALPPELHEDFQQIIDNVYAIRDRLRQE